VNHMLVAAEDVKIAASGRDSHARRYLLIALVRRPRVRNELLVGQTLTASDPTTSRCGHAYGKLDVGSRTSSRSVAAPDQRRGVSTFRSGPLGASVVACRSTSSSRT
jgi:hypothetical protein